MASTGEGMIMLKYSSGSGCSWSTAGGTADNIWFHPTTTNLDIATLAAGMSAITSAKTVRVGIEEYPTQQNLQGTYSSIYLNK